MVVLAIYLEHGTSRPETHNIVETIMKILSSLIIIGIGVCSFILGPSALSLTKNGYEELRRFAKVLHYIEDNYVTPIDENKLIQGAMKGMLDTLDVHSVYLPPEIHGELKVDTRGRFDGIGIEVSIRNGTLIIVSPIQGAPAAEAGVLAGDRILKIDDMAVTGLNLGEAVSKLRGKRGSRIKLNLRRKGEKNSFDINVTRRVIRVSSVKTKLYDDNIAYVRIVNFQQNAAKMLRKSLEKMTSDAPINGLILDLRHNPGGLLDQAVQMVDLFISKGTIVSQKHRDKIIDRQVAHQKGTQLNYPMVVLVDEGSASASEIVAAALQDHRRATIMGTTTFGKGSVQVVMDLGSKAGLKLTIAHYITPSGRVIQGKGIEPDIIVKRGKKLLKKTHRRYGRKRYVDNQRKEALKLIQTKIKDLTK